MDEEKIKRKSYMKNLREELDKLNIGKSYTCKDVDYVLSRSINTEMCTRNKDGRFVKTSWNAIDKLVIITRIR